MKQYISFYMALSFTVGTAMNGEAQLPLSLKDAMKSAARANRELHMQRLEILQSAEQLKESKSYTLPVVSAAGSYNYYLERQTIFMPGAFTNSPKSVVDVAVGGRYAFNATVTATQPIINHAVRSQIKISSVDEQVQKEKLRAVENELAMMIGQHYLSLLLQQEQVKLLEQSLKRNQKALTDSRSFFLQGKNLKTDTLRNYIAVQNINASISAIISNIDVLQLELKRLIGLEEEDTLQLTDNLNDLFAEHYFPADSLRTPGFQHRSDVRIEELNTKRRLHELSLVRSEFRPQLSAVGHYQIQSQADNLKFGNYSWPRTSFIGVAVSIPIYSGHRNKYKIRKATYAIDQQQLRVEELKSKVNTELASLFSQWKEANNQLVIHQQSVKAADISYTMMDERYKHGLASRLELTDAELALTQARMNQVQAMFNSRLLNLQIEKALGTLSLQ